MKELITRVELFMCVDKIYRSYIRVSGSVANFKQLNHHMDQITTVQWNIWTSENNNTCTVYLPYTYCEQNTLLYIYERLSRTRLMLFRLKWQRQ